jgi:tetratricopeptide (TPR) repeat protein
MRQRFDIFCSYAHVDGEAVGRLVAALKRLGLEVYRDTEEIVDFESISGSIERGLGRSKVLVAYYSASYPTRRACQWELTAAFLAAEREGDPRRRVLVVNPEEGPGHIEPVELRDELFAAATAVNDEDDADGLAKRIAEHVAEVEGLLGEVVPLVPPAWYPEPRTGSDRFVGRLGEMWAVHSGLQASGLGMITGAVSAVAQVRGLGGVGKSLLAEEYALRFGAAYPGGVFWLRAFGDGEGSLDAEAREAERERQLEGFLARLGIEVADSDSEKVRGVLARWLGQQSRPSLWVVDDLPSGLDGEVGRWLAPHPAAKTLITSRSREYDALGRRTDLDVLPEAEALELLTKRRKPETEEEATAARAIAGELGEHPLALDVAAAALRYQSFAGFLESLREPGEDWLERLTAELRDALPNGHERSIALTLSRSIDRIGEEGLDLLRLAAVLAAAPVPAELVVSVFAAVDGLEERVATARQADAVDQAMSLSLAEEADQLAWRVHALVRRAIRFKDPDQSRQAALRQAAIDSLIFKVASIATPSGNTASENVIAHARELTQHAGDPSELELLGWVARYDFERGDYRSARTVWHRHLDACRRVLGEKHSDTLNSQNNLAGTLGALGDLAGARELYEEVVQTSRRVRGEDHPDTLGALNNLAGTLGAQGDLAGARALQERVVDASRRVLGAEHPLTLTSLSNLTLTLRTQGDLAGARELGEQVLDARRRVLGEEHLDTLTSVGNLAETLRAQGDVAGVRELQEQVLEARLRVLGEEHPDTLTSLNNLAGTLGRLGDLAGARELYERVLESSRRVLGEEHPETLTSLNNLAATLWRLGDLAGARELQEQVLDARRRAFGEEHPDTLASFNNLAATLRAQGDLAGARELYEQVVETSRRVLGEEHPRTLTSLNNLAETVREQGDIAGARDLHECVLDARRRVLGEEHPDTLFSVRRLAETRDADAQQQ